MSFSLLLLAKWSDTCKISLLIFLNKTKLKSLKASNLKVLAMIIVKYFKE